MDILLDAEEARVLGCLLEKEMATPEYYPLSLNSLTNACNQKSNRNPVVDYDEQVVMDAVERLINNDLVFESRLSRVPKYEELIMKKQNLVSREASVLCVLLLRGPQTAGEIRTRTERLYAFDSLDHVHETLADLAAAGYLERFPRQPGQKEDRFGHCLSAPEYDQEGTGPGQVLPEAEEPEILQPADDPATLERIESLEQTVDGLSAELMQLKQAFEEFKKQFE